MKVDEVEEEEILGSADRTGGSSVFKWEREQAMSLVVGTVILEFGAY